MLLPEQVQIQTIDYCNRRCAWCPNSQMRKSPDTLMPVPVFDKILDDLAAVRFTGRLHLYLMAEPLCDPRLEYLIYRARERFPENGIFISTNGDGLRGVGDITRLLNAGLSEMAISHYDDSNEYLKECQDDRVIHAPLNDLRLTFYNRAGLVKVGCIEPESSCSWLWSKAYINWKGDVVLCCSDYHYEVVFGNVMESDFATIFNSARFNAYREAHARGAGSDLPLCRECNRIRKRAGWQRLKPPAVALSNCPGPGTV